MIRDSASDSSMSGNNSSTSLFPFISPDAPLLLRQLATVSREQAPVQGVKEKKSHFPQQQPPQYSVQHLLS
jgi:hypothetical protein